MLSIKQANSTDPEFKVYDRVFRKGVGQRDCAKIINRINEKGDIDLEILVQPTKDGDRIKVMNKETGVAYYLLGYPQLYGFLCGLWAGLKLDK